MRCRHRCGFSLIELLVVIGIIGLLLGLILPAVQRSRESAVRVSCLNNLRQIGIALHHHEKDQGRLPPLPVRNPPGSDPNARLGWMALILPYVEQGQLYSTSVQACRTDPNPLHNPPHIGLATVVPVYICPSDGRLGKPLADQFGVRAAFTSYIGISGTLPRGATRGLDGVLGGTDGIRLSEIPDGTSSTLMVGERPPPDSLQAGWWYPGFHGHAQGFRGPNNALILGGGLMAQGDPCVLRGVAFGPGRTDNPCDRYHLWSLHSGGANFLFADGSARFLPYSAESVVMALGSRNGNEIVTLPE